MKRLVLLSVLYIYLETGLCIIEEANISPMDANSDELSERSLGHHTSIVKRNTAFKRLPAWSVYYGKRSGEQNYDIHKTDQFDNDVRDSFDSVANDMVNDSESEEEGISKQWMIDYLENKAQNNEIDTIDAVKRANLKRLQPWMSTYGKRSSEVLNSGTGFDIDRIDSSSETGHSNQKRFNHLSQDIFDGNTDFDTDDLQSDNMLHSKRYPGWSTSYGKRAPWGVTYGKRAPWGVTYGKRAPWGVTYGKRAPWGVTYGKRGPWGVTYGKRSPWGVTYGKRAPWSVTYGKRAPWSVTYGKRAPWAATYGKRSQGWNAFYGKRAPMWQAVYGKRSSDDATVDNTVSDIMDDTEETTNSAEKRGSQAWSAFYGR